MNPNRCIFSRGPQQEGYCTIAMNTYVYCNGDKDKQRCPFWALVYALNRIETAIQMLEVKQ